MTATVTRTDLWIMRKIDTRNWSRDDSGRWAAEAGSGEYRTCDHCGRQHQIHVAVQEVEIVRTGEPCASYRKTGRTMTVGTGCAERLGATERIRGMRRVD